MRQPSKTARPTRWKHYSEGERLYLREVRPTDVNHRYVAWLNDRRVNRYLEIRFAKQTLPGVRRYVRKALADSNTAFLAIVLKDGDRHIGNLKVGPIHPIHRYADVSLFIGDKSAWGKGYATEAIQVASKYAFSRLGVVRLEAGVYEPNKGSTKAFQRSGYLIDAVLKRKWVCGPRRVDGLRLSLLRPDTRGGR